jgi:hypothetical protein
LSGCAGLSFSARQKDDCLLGHAATQQVFDCTFSTIPRREHTNSSFHSSSQRLALNLSYRDNFVKETADCRAASSQRAASV